MASSRKTQRFTPRRDIGLINKAPTATEKTNSTANVIPVDIPATQRKQSFLPAAQQIQPILAIFLLWLMIPTIKNRKNKAFKKTGSGFGEALHNSDTIINMLSDVSPYLGLQEQESIHTIIGIFEAANILNNVRAGTYRNPRILKEMSLSMGNQDRKIGIVKALKPYFPPDSREIIEKTIHTYNAVNKVSGNLVHYNKASENAEKQNNVDRIAEILEIINPLLPLEQQKRLSQIKNLIKIYGALESSQLLENWIQQEAKQSKTEDTSHKDKESDSKQVEQKKDIANEPKSTLNPEQSQAMEMMIKLAQLLSQKSSENKNESE